MFSVAGDENDLVIHEFQPRTRKSIEGFVALVESFASR